MRTISTEGFEAPKSVSAGAAPMLQWLRGSLWSCFAPVVVAPVEGGKFAIIDGQHRTTAAALVGFESVPCQVVIADQERQAAAFKAINGITTPISRMALHAAALVANEPWAVKLADVCKRAEVELLRYPVPTDRQDAGQTMAVGAIAQCLQRYGEETLITALQCVTQTTNNSPGALSARTIKALCNVLDSDRERRDRGLELLQAFDAIDLMQLENEAAVDAAVEKIGHVQAMADRIRLALNRVLPRKRSIRRASSQDLNPG